MKKYYLTIVMLLLTLVVAQKPLEELAPAGTLASLSISYKGNITSTLKQDFKKLEWDSAANTLSKLAKILISSEKLPELNNLLFDLQDSVSTFGELEQICPNLSKELAAHSQPTGFELLQTFGLGSITSPSMTFLIRSNDPNSGLSAQYDAAIACAKNTEEIPTLEQDGVKLYILNDGGDMPLVVSKHSNLIIISTNPDDVRKVIRLANGSDEKSFADSFVYKQAQAQLNNYDNSLRVSIDFEEIAKTVQQLTGMFVGKAANRAALNRVLGSLYTLGGNIYQISAVDEGILKENVLTVNPDGGDKALLRLLNCVNCQVLNPPTLAPKETIAIKMDYIPWRQSFDYLQSLVNDIATIYEQPVEFVDLKNLAKSQLGLDLDVALFDWLGSEVHSYMLEPIGPNLNTLVFSPGQLTVIPVRSVEAAKTGIKELINFALPVLEDFASYNPQDSVLGQVIPFDNNIDIPDFGSFDFSETAVSKYDYKNIVINRIRFGFNSDIAYAFVGPNLVLASPAKAMEALIDASESGMNIYLNKDFRLAKQSAPQGSSSFSYSEVDVTLNSFADLLEVFSQPLAFGINKFLTSKIEAYEGYTDIDENNQDQDVDNYVEDDVFDADIAGITVVNTILPESSIISELSENDTDNYGYFSHYYQLVNVVAGDEITATLRSEDFDTQLWLVDKNRSVYIVGNDDISDSNSNSQLSFVAQEGNDYWLEVSSFNGDGIGQYEIDVSYTGAEEMTTEESIETELDTADLEGMEATDLEISNTIDGDLSSGQVDNYGNTTVFYHLTGVNNDDIVKITLASDDFDTQLWLADYNEGVYLADNDDMDESSTDSAIIFKAKDSEDYWLEVTSYDNLDKGAFSLSVKLSDESELSSFNTAVSDEEILEADLEGMLATTISIGDTVSATLEEDEVDNYGAVTDFYEISGLNAGDSVTISMSSEEVDAQLWLVDASNNVYLNDNDDANDETTDAEINFVVEDGVSYWIEASTSSFSDSTTGSYSLSVSYSGDTGQEDLGRADMLDTLTVDRLTMEDVPSFEELLILFDLLPNSLRTLANHSSNSVSYTKTINNNVYSRELCKITW